MRKKGERVINQIRELKQRGYGIKAITRSLGVSKNTVRRYLRQEDFNETHVESSSEAALWQLAVDQRARGEQVKVIFENLAPECSYAHFARELKVRFEKSTSETPTLRLEHVPGEFTQVDYTDGLKIADRKTGSHSKTQLFCGVLPFSSLVYAEFTRDQKLSNFIRSHERMWHYFGGVSRYVIVDNLKSGVSKAHRYDPDINPTYCDYSNHCNFAVMPARVRTPRDKACVEASIGVIQRGFYARNKETVFYSLEELNTCFRRYLDELNTQIMPDYGVTRRDRFAAEKPKLRPLPASSYELYEWKKAKVHPDTCIELKRSAYSVPFHYRGTEVQVKYSDRAVIILDDTGSETLAVHPRMPPYKHSIVSEHYPHKKDQLESFSIVRAQKFAEAIGPKTAEYVDWQITTDEDHPLRALRRLMGLERLHKKISPTRDAMEYAATQALSRGRHQLRYFENCVLHFMQSGNAPIHLLAPKRDHQHIHLQKEKKP